MENDIEETPMQLCVRWGWTEEQFKSLLASRSKGPEWDEWTAQGIVVEVVHRGLQPDGSYKVPPWIGCS